MAFDFNNLANSVSKSVTKLGQGASSVTKNVTGTMKYNGMISEQKKNIEATYRELGRKYYNKYVNMQNNEFPEEMEKIKAAFKQIEFCEQQQKELAANNAPSGSFCTRCGARLNPGAAFCTKCGNKIERPQPAAPNQNNAQSARVNETAATSAQAPQGAVPTPQAPQGAVPTPQAPTSAPQGAVPTPQAPQGAVPTPQAPQGAAPTPAPQASQGAAPTPVPATVGALVQPNVSQEKICPSCGNKVGAEMMFCTQCGTKLK